MKEIELAWAAGFFDGEGCVSTVHRGNKGGKQTLVSGNCAVVQTNPEELNRFRRAVGCGRVTGPYKTKWQDRYQWTAHSQQDIAKVFDLLGNYLCSRKRAQFKSTLAAWQKYNKGTTARRIWGQKLRRERERTK